MNAAFAALLAPVPAERSALLRYRALMPPLPDAPLPEAGQLERFSLGAEGIVFRALRPYKGVELELLDLSSNSATGTVKAGSGCLIAAALHGQGVRAFGMLSSGNKANSVRAYGLRRGLSVVSFLPALSREKLREVEAPADGAKDLIVLMDAPTDEAMKAYGRRVLTALGLPCQPRLDYYEAVDRLRAAAYLERLEQAPPSTHFFQPVSSNYGLYGTYRGLEDLKARGFFKGPAPLPVGVQQEAVAPLHAVFERGLTPDAAFAEAAGRYADPELFERTLFTTAPATVHENRWLRERYGQRFLSVGRRAFRDRYPEVRERLGEAGVALPADARALGEKTGALCVGALLDAVDSGFVPAGSRVTVHLTGGVERLAPFRGERASVLDWSTSRPEAELTRALAGLLS